MALPSEQDLIDAIDRNVTAKHMRTAAWVMVFVNGVLLIGSLMSMNLLGMGAALANGVILLWMLVKSRTPAPPSTTSPTA